MTAGQPVVVVAHLRGKDTKLVRLAIRTEVLHCGSVRKLFGEFDQEQ